MMSKTIIVIHAVFMTLFVQFTSPRKCEPGTYHYNITHLKLDFCIECPNGTYMSLNGHQQTACRPCEEIRDPELEILVSPCNKTHDAVIHCVEGYYRDEARNSRETGKCKKCTQCEFPGQPCSTYRDTVCCRHRNFDVVLSDDGVPVCRERPWFCRRGQYFNTSGFYCLPCPANTFMPIDYHIQPRCMECRELESNRPLNSVIIHSCNSTHAPVTECEKGFYMDPNMGYIDDAIGCSPCTDCSTNTDVPYEGRRCNSMEDTVCCPQANMTVFDTPKGPVCCPKAEMTIVDTSEGSVCLDSTATCGVGYCLLYYISNGTSTCAPCFDNTEVDEQDNNFKESAMLSNDSKQATPLPRKAEEGRKIISTAGNNSGLTFLHFLTGLLTGLIITIMFVIILFRWKCLRESSLGIWICRKVLSLPERYRGLPTDEREEQKLLNIPDGKTPEGRPQTTPRTNSMSDHSELEQSYGNEMELEAKKDTCSRSQEHKKLIFEEDLNINNLPQGFRDQSYLAYIKAASNLTVRVSVRHVSDGRPEDDPYYDLRGLRGLGLRRFGNGLVYQVSKRLDENDNKKCPCKDCQVFPENAKPGWAEFLVVTSAQIVFDETECGQTSCKLWYDKKENPWKIPSLKGLEVKEIDREKDFCIMQCVSHNPEVIKELQERVDNFNRLHAQNKQAPNDTAYVNKLAVLIAHPHGLSKRIFLRNANAERGQVGKWTYDDYTCPGSMGAPVCLLSKFKGSKILITIYNGNRESRGFELDMGMSATALDLDDTT